MDRSHDPALFKILAHPERTAILRRLMADQATLTQLGESFHKTPAHIRHHLKVLEQAGLVEFVEARSVQGGPEKYYRAAQRALFLHEAVLPEMPKEKIGITIGSMDAGVDHLASFFAQKQAPFFLIPVPLSSLDGLIALRQGLCQMSTCHLIDPQSEVYNRPFIRHLFPGQMMALVQVYRREEGFLVKPGNPLRIRSLEDLVRPEIRFVNREPGSGVRQWLDLRLKQPGIPSELISGYSHVVYSHPEVARTIWEGKADVGIGIVAAAREFGLDFIPLFEEPYEIAVPLSVASNERYAPFFEYLNSGEIRSTIRNLDGYLVPQNSGNIEIISQVA
jgi:molybdate-binding protein/DNA-binding transcriptional ArsR family regulator